CRCVSRWIRSSPTAAAAFSASATTAFEALTLTRPSRMSDRFIAIPALLLGQAGSGEAAYQLANGVGCPLKADVLRLALGLREVDQQRCPEALDDQIDREAALPDDLRNRGESLRRATPVDDAEQHGGSR